MQFLSRPTGQQPKPVAPPMNTEYFLGIFPQIQDQSLSFAQRPYDGPDARYSGIELMRSSIISGHVAYDYSNPYRIPANHIDPEPKTPPEIYYISQTERQIAANVVHFWDVLPY